MDASVPTVRVAIPLALRDYCEDLSAVRKGEVPLSGRTVRDVLAELQRQYPQVHVRLCDERGDPRPHINVFVNDDHVRARDGLDTPLVTGDQVTILPAVSGG